MAKTDRGNVPLAKDGAVQVGLVVAIVDRHY